MAVSKGAKLAEAGEMKRLPTPVVAETYYSVVTAGSDTTEQEVRNRLLGYPRIEVDEDVARTAGELLATADDREGGDAGIGLNDAYLGAMADILDDRVVTDNVEDFEALGIQVETC